MAWLGPLHACLALPLFVKSVQPILVYTCVHLYLYICIYSIYNACFYMLFVWWSQLNFMFWRSATNPKASWNFRGADDASTPSQLFWAPPPPTAPRARIPLPFSIFKINWTQIISISIRSRRIFVETCGKLWNYLNISS